MSAELDNRLQIVTGREGDAAVLTLSGELDPHTAPVLATELDDVIAAGATTVVLELSELGFVDSSGLRVILATDGDLAGAGRRAGPALAERHGPPAARDHRAARPPPHRLTPDPPGDRARSTDPTTRPRRPRDGHRRAVHGAAGDPRPHPLPAPGPPHRGRHGRRHGLRPRRHRGPPGRHRRGLRRPASRTRPRARSCRSPTAPTGTASRSRAPARTRGPSPSCTRWPASCCR